MESNDYDIHELRRAADELRDISETEMRKIAAEISGGGAEFSKHFKGGVALGFFKRLTAFENGISEIDCGLKNLANDLEQTADINRRAADEKQREMEKNV